MSTKKFDERITTRYAEPDKEIYHKVIDLVKNNGIPKSTAQLLLVKRGLQHTENPEPLVKEKVVYKDRPVEKVVYKDKIVYQNRPKADEQGQGLSIPEHITDEQIGGSDSGQRASGDDLTIHDKTDPPHTVLEEKKSPSSHTGETQIWGGWLPLGIAGIAGLLWWFTRR